MYHIGFGCGYRDFPTANITDPFDALISFQDAFTAGSIQIQRGAVNPNIYVHRDNPSGEIRLSYVTLEKTTVTSLVMFVPCDPIDDISCFQIGYAVSPAYRKQGRAKYAILAAIEELKSGLGRNHVYSFYVEAIVGAENQASKRVAERVIATKAKAVTDKFSGKPAFQYLKKIAAPPT